MSFVERVNQGESLASWLNLLTEPPAVCWSVIIGDIIAEKGYTGPFQRPSEWDHQAVLCTACNNKHVYRQSQVRKPTGSGVDWAECSLIRGTGCRAQVFSLILDSSDSLSESIQAAGHLVSESLRSNPAVSRGRQLVSFRSPVCAWASKLTTRNIYVHVFIWYFERCQENCGMQNISFKHAYCDPAYCCRHNGTFLFLVELFKQCRLFLLHCSTARNRGFRSLDIFRKLAFPLDHPINRAWKYCSHMHSIDKKGRHLTDDIFKCIPYGKQ